MEKAKEKLLKVIKIKEEKVEKPKMILEVMQ